jgi:hypothetical protein
MTYEKVREYNSYLDWAKAVEDAGYSIFCCKCIQRCKEEKDCKSAIALNKNLQAVGLFKKQFSVGWLDL